MLQQRCRHHVLQSMNLRRSLGSGASGRTCVALRIVGRSCCLRDGLWIGCFAFSEQVLRSATYGKRSSTVAFMSALQSCAGTAPGTTSNRLRTLLANGVPLATIEAPSVPASQKGIWPATSELIARGWKARSLIFEDREGEQSPLGNTLPEVLDNWVTGLPSAQVTRIGVSLQTTPRMANNQKEFVKYLLLARSSDDDSVDQADFYYLACTNSKHAWFRPGPEWLVVVASLLCVQPGGQCTLGELTADLACLGVRVERSVLVGLLEEAGVTTDSPDADNALIIRSGF